MEHHDWDLPDGGNGDADTADLGDDPGHGSDAFDLGGHDLPGDDLGDELGGHDLGGHDLGGHELAGHDGPDALDEPLGTENAAAHFDATLADHDGDGFDGFDGPGHDAPGPDLPGPDADLHDGDYAEALFGDLSADDAGWFDHAFPPELGLPDPPEPVDGFPWSDPGTLGAGADQPDDWPGDWSAHGVPDVADLAAYEGVDLPAGADGWAALLHLDDPATSSLARWWLSS
jgi:hypothetical protein